MRRLLRWLYSQARRSRRFRIWDYDRRMRALARRNMISTEHNPRHEDVDCDRVLAAFSRELDLQKVDPRKGV